ncbi:MAG: hypothetical protein H6Q73_893 [Firmicutes bacterium]|nr:hypothetical protein [Bacillota bacterium]
MTDVQNMLQLSEVDAFTTWMETSKGYEFSDLFECNLETFRFYKGKLDPVIFYKPSYVGYLVTYGPGVELINEWRKMPTEDTEFDFLL